MKKKKKIKYVKGKICIDCGAKKSKWQWNYVKKRNSTSGILCSSCAHRRYIKRIFKQRQKYLKKYNKVYIKRNKELTNYRWKRS